MDHVKIVIVKSLELPAFKSQQNWQLDLFKWNFECEHTKKLIDIQNWIVN